MTVLMQVRLRSSTLQTRDDAVNTLYYDGFGAGESFAGRTAAIADAYAANLNTVVGGVDRVQVTAYNLSDAKPREPLNVVTRALTNVAAGPREVALCLSFFGTQNVPRKRGRIYIGPLAANWITAARPDPNLITKLTSLARALKASQGLDNSGGSWVAHSVAGNQDTNVTHAWVDDEWDTQRRRGQRPTARNQITL